ncbi:MAG TPA: hypothetical protein VNO52_17495 [Methylomirabilota bacterium]|nr:hypothetical protein [Methylomirabilota bacterium]
MPIFHEAAIRAAAGAGNNLNWLRPDHLADWSGLAAAFDRLTPEQRCDAIYADWLLQLNSPARQALLQVRDLLIGQGAIAANYLAELAQNADDASDGRRAEVRIRLEGDWLLVGNNGRKVTSMNLLGLCRFFVHAAGRVVELNDQTIGRFGIGFKSCYRIASEVFVFTWDEKGSFGFRLPICREGDGASEPDRQRLERLLDRLRQVGERQLDDELRQTRCLGYCTPEFLDDLPPDLARATEAFRQSERGSVFCFHLRPDRRQEVGSRITGQEKELYELCPLFLPNLRLVQLAQHELRMSVGQRDQAHDCPGLVEADKVTLTVRDLADANSPASNSRFWRLRGVNDGDLWQIALHADGAFRLRVEQEEDERGTTIKDGSAYAFFPLNGVNWPFRIHLHLKLPTNLARSDWNPDDAAQVEEQILRAVRGLATWLDRHADKWHPSWRLEFLMDRVPNQAERCAWLVWETLRQEANSRPLLRTVWGTRCCLRDARKVHVVDREAARRNWMELCAHMQGLQDAVAVVDAVGVVDFGLEELPENQLRQLLLRAAEQAVDDAGRRRLVMALFSLESATPETIEAVADRIRVPRLDGAEQCLAELMQQPAGAELPESWHQVFRTLHNWLWNEDHGLTAVFGGQLRFKVRTLAQPVFNPSWEAIPTVMGNEQAWQQHGAKFWQLDRQPCPTGIRNTVLQCLRVKDGSNRWRPVASVWLGDNSPVNCFHGVVGKWERGSAPNNEAQQAASQKLQQWGLWEAWESAVEKELEERLPVVLFQKLQDGRRNPFERVLDAAHTNSRNNLPRRWQAVVDEAEREATRRFLAAHRQELGDGRLLSRELDALAEVLTWTGRYTLAPDWLTEDARRRLATLGEAAPNLEVLTRQQVNNRARELAETLLGQFHRWRERELSQAHVQAIEKLLDETPPTLRGNWRIGLTNQTSHLLKDFFNPAGGVPSTGGNTDATANLPLLNHPDSRWLGVQELPPVLRRFPSVVSGCLQSQNLHVEVSIEGACLPITEADVEPGTRQDGLFQTMLRACGDDALRGCRGKVDVRWTRSGQLVVELRGAPFAVRDGRLITSRTTVHIEDRQFNEVLAVYSRRVRDNPAFHQRWQQPNLDHAELYAEFRQDILKTLLKTEVKDLGYREHHVIRELLQNAESAYDSEPGELPSERDFEFLLRPSADGRFWEGVASHSGRHFNEPVRLPDGGRQPRDDIRLIVSTPAAEAAPTEGWIGRFNRGFKSIFTVAESVRIRSGPYEFTIQDLLLLNPANPQPVAERFSPRTTFSFRCKKPAVLKLLNLPALDGDQQPLPVFNPSTFLFLQQTNRVRVQADRFAWEWAIRFSQLEQGWAEVEIHQSHPQSVERFLVFRSRLPPERGQTSTLRYSVGLRIARTGEAWRPRPLEDGWRRIRLTFETEDPFPLDILVNGDFETDSGRLGIRHNSSVNERLLATCLEAAGDLCRTRLQQHCALEDWLAWADVFHLREGEEQLRHQFETHHKTLAARFKKIREFLCTHIPGPNGLGRADAFHFPSPLVRRLNRFVQSWGFLAADWIDPRIEERLPRSLRDEQEKVTLDGLVGRLSDNAPVLQTIDADFQSDQFQAALGNLDAISRSEFDRAKRMLEQTLRPAVVRSEEIRPVELWTVQNLWQWWQRQGAPSRLYTLDGENWPLLFSNDSTPKPGRCEKLRNHLSRPGSEDGQRVWYRLLGLACLMSAGWGRASSLRDFWQKTLGPAQFWERTTENNFAEATQDLFSTLVNRTHSTAAAAGEAAEYWRHIFYDVRKVHELVFGEYRFAETIWELASDPRRAGELPQFLRSGRLGGQAPLAGVLGQSAGAPIYFVVRELCRLGIVPPQASANLRPLAFFACTPVRRAAASIGWIDTALAVRTDFESLAEVSRQLHKRISEDESVDDTTRQQLLDLYDIPLLHLGLTE